MTGEIKNTEFVRLTLNHLNHYIAAADKKASILLTGHLAFIGLLGNAIKGSFQSPSIAFLIVTGLAVASSLAAAVLALLVVLPRTPETPTGFILWSSILEMSETEYREEMLDLDSGTALKELAGENYALTKVADKKYNHLRRSLIATFVMVFFALLSYSMAVL